MPWPILTAARASDRRRKGYGAGIAIVVAVAVLGYWLTLPPDRYVLDASCSPAGLTSALSARLYGADFWRRQQTAVGDEIKTLQELENQARSGSERGVTVTHMEQQMRRLSDKEMADPAAGNEQTWRNQILRLGHCEEMVASHLPK